jgi:hypothetical protein
MHNKENLDGYSSMDIDLIKQLKNQIYLLLWISILEREKENEGISAGIGWIESFIIKN